MPTNIEVVGKDIPEGCDVFSGYDFANGVYIAILIFHAHFLSLFFENRASTE